LSWPASDIDSLVQYERDAKDGRADALYNLGLAYSTGQGVGVDMVAAHKWFNLAAVRGVEAAKSWRNQLAAEMTTGQIAEAQKLARGMAQYFQALIIFAANSGYGRRHWAHRGPSES